MLYFVYHLLSVLFLISYKFEVYVSILGQLDTASPHLITNSIVSGVSLCREKNQVSLANNAIVFIYTLYVFAVCFCVNAKQGLVISLLTA